MLRDILTFLPGNGMGVGKLLKRWNYYGYRVIDGLLTGSGLLLR
jgi:hypothetical protein